MKYHKYPESLGMRGPACIGMSKRVGVGAQQAALHVSSIKAVEVHNLSWARIAV